MLASEFQELLDRVPFEPLRLRMTDGTVHEIRHPEMALVEVSVVWLYFPAKTVPIPFGERKLVISLQHILQIEFLTPPQAPPAN